MKKEEIVITKVSNTEYDRKVVPVAPDPVITRVSLSETKKGLEDALTSRATIVEQQEAELNSLTQQHANRLAEFDARIETLQKEIFDAEAAGVTVVVEEVEEEISVEEELEAEVTP